MTASVIMNALIALGTFVCVLCGLLNPKDGRTLRGNLKIFRFFTVLSNVLSGVAAVVMLACSSEAGAPACAVVFKFAATAAVTVTLLTVLVFLGPTQGYPLMFSGTGLFMHLIGPLLAVVSFCFFDPGEGISFASSLWGLVPTVAYGILYMYKVIVVGEEKGGWPDFYGFNAGGKWLMSCSAMVAGTFVICLLLKLLRGA